jgi:H+/gluconate symporter-like permease
MGANVVKLIQGKADEIGRPMWVTLIVSGASLVFIRALVARILKKRKDAKELKEKLEKEKTEKEKEATNKEPEKT